jgi:MFS family permease
MVGLAAFPALLQGICMIFMPESQRWLAKNQKTEECKKTLERVYDKEGAEIQLIVLQQEVHKMRKFIDQSEWQRYKQLFTVYRKCLFIGCSLQFFQQFVGINTVMYYGPQIIIDSGQSIDGIDDQERLAIILNIPLAATNAIFSLVAVFIIDNLGRRYIMLRTLPWIFTILIGIALGMYIIRYDDDDTQKYPVRIVFMLLLVLYLAFFSTGMSSTPWAVNSEIYPIHLVGTACALSTATNWLSNFVVASVFLTSMETEAGKVYTFVILAGFAALATAFVYFLVPETSGRKI